MMHDVASVPWSESPSSSRTKGSINPLLGFFRLHTLFSYKNETNRGLNLLLDYPGYLSGFVHILLSEYNFYSLKALILHLIHLRIYTFFAAVKAEEISLAMIVSFSNL